MRARLLEAIARPIADIQVAARKLKPAQRAIHIARAVEAKVDFVDRTLETLSLGIALAEVYFRSREEEREP